MSDEQPPQEQQEQQPRDNQPFPLRVSARTIINNTSHMPYSALPRLSLSARRSLANPSQPGPSSQEHDAKAATTAAPAPTFEPSPVDAIVARMLLQRGLNLPPEIVDSVIDHAEYWPHSTTEAKYREERGRPFSVRGRSGGGVAQDTAFLFRCPPVGLCTVPSGGELSYERHEAKPEPLRSEFTREFFESQIKGPKPGLAHPVRKIVFTLRSHDQGWADGDPNARGGYAHSHTWFEAGLERFDADEKSDGPDSSYDISDSKSRADPPALNVSALRSIYLAVEPEPAPTEETAGQSAGESMAPAQTYKIRYDLHPNHDHLVQTNRRATQNVTEHRVVWSWTDNTAWVEEPEDVKGRGRGTFSGKFVRELKLGDVVTLWAMARYPGWQNIIESARVDVYWAV